MRFASPILAIFVLFLAVAPSLSLVAKLISAEECKKSCCSHSEQKSSQKENKSDNCCKDFCNPFLSCCNGSALVSESYYLPSKAKYSDQHFTDFKQNPYSAYIADAWNPPKFS
jgi:hypothetical protein